MDLHKVYQRTLQLNYVFTLIIHIDKQMQTLTFFRALEIKKILDHYFFRFY